MALAGRLATRAHLGEYSSLTEQRAQVAAEGRQIETEAGPIAYVATIFGVADSEKAIRWLKALMVLCCDPLAIALTAAASASAPIIERPTADDAGVLGQRGVSLNLGERRAAGDLIPARKRCSNYCLNDSRSAQAAQLGRYQRLITRAAAIAVGKREARIMNSLGGLPRECQRDVRADERQQFTRLTDGRIAENSTRRRKGNGDVGKLDAANFLAVRISVENRLVVCWGQVDRMRVRPPVPARAALERSLWPPETLQARQTGSCPAPAG
jgi:hypothetical protein